MTFIILCDTDHKGEKMKNKEAERIEKKNKEKEKKALKKQDITNEEEKPKKTQKEEKPQKEEKVKVLCQNCKFYKKPKCTKTGAFTAKKHQDITCFEKRKGIK